MRRTRQQLSQQDCIDLLHRGSAGVLALRGDDDYPYAVPLSYVYKEGRLYFHSAKSGHKLDAIHRWQKGSFCVIDQDRVIPEEYTTYFRSVIAFGRLQILTDTDEIQQALQLLAQKYHPTDDAAHRTSAIQAELSAVCVFSLTIEHLSGKEAIELVRSKKV